MALAYRRRNAAGATEEFLRIDHELVISSECALSQPGGVEDVFPGILLRVAVAFGFGDAFISSARKRG